MCSDVGKKTVLIDVSKLSPKILEMKQEIMSPLGPPPPQYAVCIVYFIRLLAPMSQA